MSESIKDKVAAYMTDHFLVDFGDGVTNETNLFKGGFIDSFGLLELVTYLEKTFKIKITDDELVSDDLISVTNITNCINRKLHVAA